MKHFSSPIYALGWLRAFCDSEGHIKAKGYDIDIVMCNTEESMINEAQRHLDGLGISWRVSLSPRPRNPSWKPIYKLYIRGRDSIIKFIVTVGSSIPYKRQAMARILRHYRRPYKQWKYQRPGRIVPDADEFRALLDRGMNHGQISEQFGMPYRSVLTYVKKYGLTKKHRTGPDPDRDLVYRAYWVDGLTMMETGALFGYSSSKAVARLFERQGIASRKDAPLTHCRRGHPFDERNTYYPPNGRRVCRTCARAHKQEEALRHREQQGRGK